MRVMLSPRDQRAVGIGAAALILLVASGHGIPRWRRWLADARQDAAAAEADYARARTALAQRAQLRVAHDAFTAQRTVLDSVLLAGDSPAASSAELTALVGRVADATEVSLGALDVRADTTRARHVVPVQLRTTVTADAGALSAFLGGLEAEMPWLWVRELHITQSAPTAVETDPEVLQAGLLIEGLARRTPAPPPDAEVDASAPARVAAPTSPSRRPVRVERSVP